MGLAKPTGVLDLSAAQQKAVAERLFAKVVWNGDEDECWIWEGARTSVGYGLIRIKDRAVLAHRLVYELFAGPIPEGLQIDHVCHNDAGDCEGGPTCRHRACVNPAHLEPVTHAENCIRGGVSAATASALAIGWAIQRAKTHCPAGHPYAGANLYISKAGHRNCRTCHREHEHRRYKRAS